MYVRYVLVNNASSERHFIGRMVTSDKETPHKATLLHKTLNDYTLTTSAIHAHQRSLTQHAILHKNIMQVQNQTNSKSIASCTFLNNKKSFGHTFVVGVLAIRHIRIHSHQKHFPIIHARTPPHIYSALYVVYVPCISACLHPEHKSTPAHIIHIVI